MAQWESRVLIVDTEANLPSSAFEGVMAFTQDSNLLWVYYGSAWHEAGSLGRLPSLDNPPASAHAYDDEFNETTLDAKWTTSISAAGTINPVTTLSSTEVYDLESWPSWLLFQGHNASATTRTTRQTITADTDATIFFKAMAQSRGYTGGAAQFATSAEVRVGVALYNNAAGFGTDDVRLYVQSSGPRITAQVTNGGASTVITGDAFTDGRTDGSYYGVIYKTSNTYRIYVLFPGGGNQYLGSLTKTGTTTMDRLAIFFSTSDDTITPILGVDFVRYYASNTFALVNP